MSRHRLSLLIHAVRDELAVPTGRNEWLNIATVGHLHEHIAFVRGARSDAARAAWWPPVAALVARVYEVPVDRLQPDTDFGDLPDP